MTQQVAPRIARRPACIDGIAHAVELTEDGPQAIACHGCCVCQPGKFYDPFARLPKVDDFDPLTW